MTNGDGKDEKAGTAAAPAPETVAHVARALREGAELRLSLIETLGEAVARAGELLAERMAAGGKLLLLGNGGSAADAQHVAAEFTGRFVKERRPLPAVALTTDTSALTAIGNDYGYAEVFARQVRALGRPGDVLLAISTSGNSPSVLEAVRAAREVGMAVLGLTGRDGGALAPLSDIALVVPAANTARIQECHLAIEHLLCEIVEDRLFPDAP